MSQLTTIKKVKNATLFHDASGQPLIRIDNVRFSYPFIGTPSEDESEDGTKRKTWRVVAMLPKATHLDAKNLCKEVITQLMTTNSAKVPSDKWFLADGDSKEAEEMQGHWLVTASDGKNRPKARDGSGNVMDNIDDIDELFVGGHWGHVLIRPWFFAGKAKNSSKTFPKRVSAGLNAIVFWKKDKTFGSGRIDDSDAWDGLPASEGSNAGMDDAPGGDEDL